MAASDNVRCGAGATGTGWWNPGFWKGGEAPRVRGTACLAVFEHAVGGGVTTATMRSGGSHRCEKQSCGACVAEATNRRTVTKRI